MFLSILIKISVEPNCGCSLLQLSKEEMSPFGVATLWVSVDTIGIQPGNHQESLVLTLRSNQRVWQQLVKIQFTIR
jgi:hypothetical protein